MLFCAAFDCSNNKRVQKAWDFFRFQKETNLVVNKKDELYGEHQAYLKLNKINNTRSTC